MATPTWEDRELPILEAIGAAEEAGDDIGSGSMAKEYYNQVNGCYYCANACHTT